MTKIFISYSFDVQDLSLINHIYSALDKNDSYEVSLSRAFDPNFNEINPNLATISTYDFFIGLITEGSSRSQREKVIEELLHAKNNKLAAVLLVESGLRLNFKIPEAIEQIRFNRGDEESTMENVKKVLSKHDSPTIEQIKEPNAFAWIIGAVAVMVIVALLTSKKD